MKNMLFVLAVTVITSFMAPPYLLSAAFPMNSAQRMMFNGEFAELDKMADEYRKTKKVLGNGRWALTQLYYDLTKTSTDKGTESEYETLIESFEAWIEARPDSPTPRVALSRVYRYYAFLARGGGWASSVKPEQWDVYHERMDNAYEFASHKAASTDIRSYSERIHILRLAGRGDVKEQAYEVFEEGYRLEPDYYPLYYAMTELLEDRWHGDRFDTINFIRESSERKKGIEGKVLFVKLLSYAYINYQNVNFLNRMSVAWSELEPVFKDILQKRPDDKYVMNLYWLLATVSLELEKANEISQKLDKANGWLDPNEIWLLNNHAKYLKSLVSMRKRIIIFNLDISSIWNRRHEFEAHYEICGPDGKVLVRNKYIDRILADKTVRVYYAMNNIVYYIILPEHIVNNGGKIQARFSIINRNTGKKAENVKFIDL